MERERISAITHGDLAVHNPIPVAKLDALLARVDAVPGETAFEVGCGPGELLVRLALRSATAATGGSPIRTATGVDRSAALIEAGRARAAAAGVADRVSLVCGDALDHLPAEPVGLTACVGSSHALDGADLGAALGRLAALTLPGGWVLFGDGYWARPPSEAFLARLGATRDELPDHAGLVAAGAPHGLAPVAATRASVDDWDAYEWTLIANGDAYARQHPDEPGIDRLRAWVDAARDRYAGPDGADTLGFALVLFRRT